MTGPASAPGFDWQTDGEAGARAGLAGDFEGATVRLNDGFGNRQAQTAAPGGARPVGAIEALEDVRQVLSRNPLTRIAHRENDRKIGRASCRERVESEVE